MLVTSGAIGREGPVYLERVAYQQMRVGGNVTLTTRRTAGTGDPVVGSVTAGWKDSVWNGKGFCLNKAST